MPFTQVKDVLKRAIGFHKSIEEFYEGIENTTEKEAVKILVDYLARHEKVMKEDLEKITEEQKKLIKEEWIKYDAEYAKCQCLDDVKVDKTSGVDDVIDAGLKLNQCLIDLYHFMAEEVPVREVKDLFKNLETMEVAEKKKLARMRGM